eukprot:COSAG01_NODE_2219_length_8143_cov_100.563083_3_plen_262_part_00
MQSRASKPSAGGIKGLAPENRRPPPARAAAHDRRHTRDAVATTAEPASTSTRRGARTLSVCGARRRRRRARARARRRSIQDCTRVLYIRIVSGRVTPALQNSPADSDRSQPAVSSHAAGFRSHTARVRSVSESTGACMRPHSAGDCKRESSPRAAPQLGKVHPRMGRRGQSRVRPGQVASAMRVRAGVAPRMASGDRAASKGKPAGGCSSFKRRVEREERCAAPHARARRLPPLHRHSRGVGDSCRFGDDSHLPQRPVGLS